MRLLLLTLVAYAAVELTTASAAEVSDSVMSLGEISVTAMKSTGSISARPVAATVIGSSEIDRLNIVTMKGVSEIAPNFYIPDYGSRMTSSIYVRGIGARIDQPAVGLTVDNVAFMNKDNYDFDLVDIERIEVLRGPQSTLFGRNTMGGQVNIYTLSPLRYHGVRLMAEAATGNRYKGAASVYFPVANDLGMGVSAYCNYAGGFFTNLHSGRKADREEGGSLRWKTSKGSASSTWSIENTAALSMTRQHGYPYAFVETGTINYNDTCFYRRTGLSDGLSVLFRPDDTNLSVHSVTSIQYIDDNMTLDQDFLTDSYFNLTQARKEIALTQDFVAKGSAGNYRWLGGLFGFFKRAKMRAPVTFKETGIERLIEDHRNEANPHYPIRWDDDSFILNSDFTNPVGGAAVYHQSELTLGQWTISAALRLDWEHTSLDYSSYCNTSYTVYSNLGTAPSVFSVEQVALDDRGKLKKSFVQLLPRATATYNLPEGATVQGLIYGSVAKGYKAGGYNTQMFSDVLQQRLMETMGLAAKYDVSSIVGYKPEKSWNYELGAHLRYRSLTANIALFYIDCRDQQLTMFPDGTTTGRIMTNAGKTRSYGFETSVNWRPSDRIAFRASYGMTDARFVRFDNGIESFDGKRVPYAPANTLFTGAEYSLPLQSQLLRSINFDINCRGVGNIYWDEKNEWRQPFYAQLGASVRLEFDYVSVDIWGENLTDTRFNTFQYQSIGNRFFQQGKPCRGGVTLRSTFCL